VSRIFLFMATNMAVMVVFSIITAVFGLDRAIGASNVSLVIYAGLFGFAGSFISLFMSKSMAIRSMRVQLIDQPTNETERWIQETVHAQAREAGIGLPDVGIFQQASPNAFATGWNKNNSCLIAAWFSRQREFRADAGGAKLAGRENMISALAALKRGSGQGGDLPDRMAAFGISSSNIAKLTSTHPPLDERIARLRAEA